MNWEKAIDDFASLGVVEVTHGKWKLEWEWIGEGYDGDWQADDPKDKPLLRADLSYMGKIDFELEDVSYCTLTPVNVKRGDLERISLDLLKQLPEIPDSPRCAKRAMEWWTWRTDPSKDPGEWPKDFIGIHMATGKFVQKKKASKGIRPDPNEIKPDWHKVGVWGTWIFQVERGASLKRFPPKDSKLINMWGGNEKTVNMESIRTALKYHGLCVGHYICIANGDKWSYIGKVGRKYLTKLSGLDSFPKRIGR